MLAPPGAVRDKFKGLVGFRNRRSPSEWARNTMTDAVTSGTISLLALVPGRPEIKTVHKLAAIVNIGERNFPVIATMREATSGQFQYDLRGKHGRGLGGNPEARQSDAQLRDPALEGTPAARK